MLKILIAKHYSDINPTIDIISTFNDNNSAKLMATLMKRGLVVYGVSKKVMLGFLDEEEYVFIRNEYLQLLEDNQRTQTLSKQLAKTSESNASNEIEESARPKGFFQNISKFFGFKFGKKKKMLRQINMDIEFLLKIK